MVDLEHIAIKIVDEINELVAVSKALIDVLEREGIITNRIQFEQEVVANFEEFVEKVEKEIKNPVSNLQGDVTDMQGFADILYASSGSFSNGHGEA